MLQLEVCFLAWCEGSGTLFLCWATAASSSTCGRGQTRVPSLGVSCLARINSDARAEATHGRSWRRLACAYRHGMVKRGRRVGHSGLLVAQQLERCDLGADGASGLRGRHDISWLAWSRWALVCQTRSVGG